MASEQPRRENKVEEKEVKVEKDRVPKMTSHFESIAEKGKEDSDRLRQQQSHHHDEGETGGTHFVSLSDKGISDEGDTKMKKTQMPHSVGKFVVSSGDKEETGKEEEQEKASLEDIQGYRASAQQKSMDTIRAAEERYNKAKESLSHGGQGGQQMEGKGRESGVHVTHVGMEKGRESTTAERERKGQESGGGRIHGGGGAGVVGQEGPGRVGVELAGKGREEKESGAHGFHGEKARHAQLLAAGGEELKERKGQESVGGGGGGGGASDTVTEKRRQAKESVGQGAQKGQETKEQAGRTKDYTMEKAGEAKDTTAEKARRASEYATEKGKEAGNTAAEQAARAKDYTLQKAVEAKDTAAEQAVKAKDYTLQKAVEAKDIAAEKAQKASEYLTGKGKETGNLASQKGQEAKEQTVSMTGKAKDYTVQKAGEAAEYAKETMVEGGKGAAHYAGVAAEKAAAAGWTAAHFTTEKVVQGTKAVAGTVEGAVGYAGNKAAEVGSKAVDLTKEKAAAVGDTVVGYTARKKEESQHKDQEMHQGGEEEKGPGFVTEPRRAVGEEYGGEGESEDVFGYGTKGVSGEARRDVGEERRDVDEEEMYGGGRRNERYVQEEGIGAGGVLGAIGETIAEIAQTTKNIVIGDAPERTQEHGPTGYMREERGHR